MSKTLYSSIGIPIVLGRELGKGGEGSVYEVPALTGQVAKLYHKPPDAKKQAKLSFMAATVNAQLLNYVAWPQDTLYLKPGGTAVGFLMPKVAGKNPIHMIYSPAHRRQEHPKAAWDFLVYVARNIAASFVAIHEHGHVVGDVNQSNFMVGRDSKVLLIDSDSFQVNAQGTLHFCGVGVAHFTPPELQSVKSFDGLARTENHDNFGLALLIFHVLFGGRHPFSGVPLRNDVGNGLEEDIKHFRYAYAKDNQSRGITPPPRSIPVSMLPNAMESMFHLAFTQNGATVARPTAQQWVSELDGLRGRLRKCSSSAMHIHPNHLLQCPWCVLEQQGSVYFIDIGTSFTPTLSGFVLTQTLGFIQAISAPTAVNPPSSGSFKVKAHPLPNGIPGEETIFFYRVIAIAIAIAIIFAAPNAWLLAFLAGWAGWAIVGSAGSSQRSAETQKRQDALQKAKNEYELLLNRAKRDAGPEGFNARKDDILKQLGTLKELPQEEQREIDKLHSTARERQMHKFLDTCFIDKANIAGVGPARKTALRSFGVETAADVNRNQIMQVHGFGQSLTRATLDWKASCARRFVFNPATAVSNSDRDTVHTKYALRRIALERALATAPAELQRFRQQAATQLASLRPQLEAAARTLAQAQADLAIM